jgi:hypothetical protein
MIYVVLGMHKSGTTLVSQILHRSGINMMDELDTDTSYDKGNKHERESTKAVNHKILDSEGVFSLEIDLRQPPQSSADQRAEINKIIRDCSSKYNLWGFKDPRTCLTYPIWASELPEHKVIVIYRSPYEIWQRYRKRHKYSSNPYAYWRGVWAFMTSWCNHNRRIITALENSKVSFLVLNYEKFMTQDSDFDRLEKFVGLKLIDCRNRSLYRHHGHTAADKMLDAFCFLQTLSFPHDIAKKLENLKQSDATI